LAHEAQRIVDQVLEQSLVHMRETMGEENSNDRGQFIESENDQWKGEAVVRWPKISEFTDANVGLEKINEYIEKVIGKFCNQIKSEFELFFKEWKTTPGGQDECWLYAIDFIERKSLEFTDLYIYRVSPSIHFDKLNFSIGSVFHSYSPTTNTPTNCIGLFHSRCFQSQTKGNRFFSFPKKFFHHYIEYFYSSFICL
jgi:hypothetical protein